MSRVTRAGFTAFALCAVVACTKENPAAKCSANGTCTDPAYPFCDVDGSVAGHPGACISVTCTAGQFKSCADGSDALVCDATGSTYTHAPCVNGCDPVNGCITCTANTQTCANGSATRCDGNGVLSTETCSLGCSANDSTRCTRIVPSNGLGTYYDVASPVDVDLAGTLELDSSTYYDASGSATVLPSYTLAAPSDGTDVRVFVVKHLSLGDLTITSTTATQNGNGVGPAVAFLATEDIVVTGRVEVDSGAVTNAGCSGSAGMTVGTYYGGGGGGTYAGAGYKGGDAPGGATGGPAGASVVGPEIVPLRGGCPGGGISIAGGAIQLVSMTTIDISGMIVADGHGARVRSGGGGGGGILIEAPTVTLGSAARLLARGGGGGAGAGSNPNAPPAPDDGSSPPGGVCVPTGTFCGAGGAGASNAAGHTGGTATATGGSSGGGGGGGGAGQIRINTLDGNVTEAPGSIVSGYSTTGTLTTI